MSLDNFIEYQREDWRKLQKDTPNTIKIDDLQRVVSLNDRLTQADVYDIYGPLIQYIDIYIKKRHTFYKQQRDFLQHPDCMVSIPPFIIGISGSVAVGKSTVARVLKQLLEQAYPGKNVDLITTDGFLYPNETLKYKGIYNRKGFPESYDMVGLLHFMNEVKLGNGQAKYPIYSHEIYDIVPGEYAYLNNPNILIVEGINVFQLPQNQQLYVSDYFDFSIYVDAETTNIKKWYMERFYIHIDLAKNDPNNYYSRFIDMTPAEVEEFGNEVWYTVNLTNLIQHIAPTRGRANLILHKGENHFVDRVYVRQY